MKYFRLKSELIPDFLHRQIQFCEKWQWSGENGGHEVERIDCGGGKLGRVQENGVSRPVARKGGWAFGYEGSGCRVLRLVFSGWAEQRHVHGNFQKFGLRSEAGKDQRYLM